MAALFLSVQRRTAVRGRCKGSVKSTTTTQMFSVGEVARGCREARAKRERNAELVSVRIGRHACPKLEFFWLKKFQLGVEVSSLAMTTALIRKLTRKTADVKVEFRSWVR